MTIGINLIGAEVSFVATGFGKNMTKTEIQSLLEDGTTIGSILRGERMTLGKSVDDVHNELKLKVSLIEGIEANEIIGLDRPEFISGTIRTYAKYLGLNATEVLEAFRQHHGLETVKVQPQKVPQKNRHKNTAMGVGFHQQAAPKGFVDHLISGTKSFLGASPLIIATVGLVFLGVVGVRFFSSIQDLNVVPTEIKPEIVASSGIDAASLTGDGILVDNIPTINYDELYARQALSVPVVELRDGPIAQIGAKPAPSSAGGETPIEVASSLTPSEPLVSVGPIVPKVELLPLGETWVQVSTEAGNKVLESLLQPGEVIEVPLEGDINFLKAGNATQLYVRVSGEIYGPIGKDGASVVRNIPMLPTELVAAFEKITPEKMDQLQKVETSFLAKLEAQ